MNRIAESLGVIALMGTVAGGFSYVYLRPSEVPPPTVMPPVSAPLPPPLFGAHPQPAPAPAFVPAPVRDVPWFRTHRVELKAKLAACQRNPGIARMDPECDNAAFAKQKNDIADVIRSIPD